MTCSEQLRTGTGISVQWGQLRYAGRLLSAESNKRPMNTQQLALVLGINEA